MDDFMFFTDNKDAVLHPGDRVASLLDRLGQRRNPKTGHWELTQICEPFGLEIDANTSRASTSKLHGMCTML
jgi:hypothetical protein